MRLRFLLLAGAVFMAPQVRAQDAAPSPEPGVDDPVFRNGARNAIPLTPEMIIELGRRYKEAQGARETIAAPAIASPSTRSVNVATSSGGAVPIIQTVQGYPTALAFVDSTGQPWPIAWDTNSNPTSTSSGGQGAAVQAQGFDVHVPLKGSNVLQIAPRSSQPRGGLLVNLEGSPVPLAFMVVGGRHAYDARVDVRVAGRGPNARVEIITRPNIPETGAANLTAMLDGVPPADAVPLSVTGISPDDGRAWRLGDKIYLRTQYTVLSPEWTASENGLGGMTIYALPSTPNVLLSDRNTGRSVTAHLSE